MLTLVLDLFFLIYLYFCCCFFPVPNEIDIKTTTIAQQLQFKTISKKTKQNKLQNNNNIKCKIIVYAHFLFQP